MIKTTIALTAAFGIASAALFTAAQPEVVGASVRHFQDSYQQGLNGLDIQNGAENADGAVTNNIFQDVSTAVGHHAGRIVGGIQEGYNNPEEAFEGFAETLAQQAAAPQTPNGM